MHILHVNNFLGVYGGAEAVLAKTIAHQRRQGHTVSMFGTNKPPLPDDLSLPESSLVEYINYDELEGIGNKLKVLIRPIYNMESQQKMSWALKALKPDLVHYHSVHWHLSPAVIQPAAAMGIPIVMTLHEARNICPAGTLMRGGHTFCEEALCATDSHVHCMTNRCYEGSLAKSTFVATEYAFRHVHRFFDRVNQFIVPSPALADLLERKGRNSHRITVALNPIDDEWLHFPEPQKAGEYFMFAGRLSPEKGVHTLLKAYAQSQCPIPLKIAGTGEDEARLKAMAQEMKLHNVEFIGFQSQEQLKELFGGAIANVVPSEWFESFGLTVVESMAHGRPVITTDAGGPRDLVHASGAGELFPMGDVNALAEILTRWGNNPEAALAMAPQAQHFVREHCSLETYGQTLENVYNWAKHPEQVEA